MSAFNNAFHFVLRMEGGYVNDPNDPGGETNMGISKRSYPNEDIKGMTKLRAMQIYKQDFWDEIRASEMPPGVALCVFDAAVNMGVKQAAKLLQKVLRVKVDGDIGDKTLGALQDKTRAVPGKRLTRDFCVERIKKYSEFKGWAQYKNSWTHRTFESFWVALEEMGVK